MTGNDLDRYRRALAELPVGHSHRPPILNALAVRLRARASSGDLDDAVRYAQEAAAGDADRVYLNTLGNALADRYAAARDDDDLDRAIEVLGQAVAACPPDDPDLPAFGSNLASSLCDRFQRDGCEADLDRAIELFEGSLEAASPASPERGGLANNLASALQERYAHAGSLDDLERAVGLARDAVRQTPEGAGERALVLNSLAAALLSRHARADGKSDLDEAIALLETGLALTGTSTAQRTLMLGNLGVALSARGDVDGAVSAHRAAARAARGTVGEALQLDDLAAALLDRHQRGRGRRDLKLAIRTWRRALAATPAAAPPRARRLANLARGLSLRAESTGRRRDIARATRAYVESCAAGLRSDPEATLAAAIEWGRWADRAGTPAAALPGYVAGMQALDRLARAQIRRGDKELWLRDATEVASGAARAWLAAGDPGEAAVAAERGRAAILSEALQRDRAELSELSALGHDDLVKRYRDAARIVARLERTTIRLTAGAAPL